MAGFIKEISDEALIKLCKQHPEMNLLTWDENVQALKERLNDNRILG